MWVRRIDCRKRVGIEAKGMERKCVTEGLDEEGVRPVSEPRRGCVNVWILGVDMLRMRKWLLMKRVAISQSALDMYL